MRKHLESVSAVALAIAWLGSSSVSAQTTPPADQGTAQQQAAQEVASPPIANAQIARRAAATDAGEQGKSSDEVIVTGSRIQTTGMASPTPVTMLSATDFNKMAPGSISDALDRLPQFLNSPSTSGDATSGVSDAGGTNLNLRGLGTSRTLTLLNGRRVVPNSEEGAVNIDIFPELVIKRIDIVTGGASAAYGTDAVAGVVNFILDTEYTGLKGDFQGGESSRNDAKNYTAQLAYGHDIGSRAHIVLSADYSHQGNAGTFAERDWYQSWSLINNPAWVANKANTPIYLTASNVVGTNFTCEGMITGVTPAVAAAGSGINRLTFGQGGAPATPFVQTSLSVIGGNNAQSRANGAGGSGCDQHAMYPLLTPQNKAHAFAYLNFDVAPDVKLYLQGLFSNDSSDFGPSSANMAPAYNATIYVGNPFIPADIASKIATYNTAHPAAPITSFALSRDNSDIFPASTNDTTLRNRTYVLTGGLDAKLHTGGLFDAWKISSYAQFSENDQRVGLYGKQREAALYQALDAVRDPATGNIVCNAALQDPAHYSDCVPINLFGQGLASQAAINYVTTPLKGDPEAIIFYHTLKELDAEATASGDVFDGIGAGPVTAAVGASYRKQQISSKQTGASVDLGPTPTNGSPGIRGIPASISGDPDQQFVDSFADVEGKIDVKEVFGELNIPLLKDKPVFRDLTLDLAARYADYSGSGGILAYKAGLEWQVIPDIKLRGTYSRDVRAATLAERYDSQRVNGTVTNDPVVGKPVSGTTYNVSTTSGGNPDVKPETADTYTLGVVLQPKFVPGAALSIDYYNVSISQAIAQLGAPNIVNQCAAGATDLCALITRDPDSGQVIRLLNVFINIAKETARGMDVEFDYHHDVSLLGGDEALAVRGLASFLFDRSLSVPGAPKLELAGQLATQSSGDDFSYSKLQMTGNFEYRNGPVTLTLQERFIKGGKLNNTYVEGVDVDNNHVDSVWYTDLGVSYAPIKNVEVYGYISNLFDRDPPLAPEPFTTMNGALQTNRQLYDLIGRRFLAGVRFHF